MPVNWSLGLSSDIGGAFQKGFEEARYKNALTNYVRSPNEQALNALAPHAPEFALGEKRRMAQQAEQQQAAQLSQIPVVLRMLETARANPQAYQTILAKAKQLGIHGVETAPPQYDPQWIEEQIRGLTPFASPQGREILSQAGKRAYDEGFQPGTPEFAARVTELIGVEETKITGIEGGGTIGSFNPLTGKKEILAGPSAGAEYNPDEWEVVGDAGGNASGGF